MVGVVALVLAIHDIPLANHLETVERDRLATKFERDAFILGGRSEEALEDGSAATDTGLNAMVLRYASEEDVEVVITDADGIGVVSSDTTKVGEDLTNRTEIEQALAIGEPQTGERYSDTLGSDLFFVAVPVLSGDDRVGAVRISAPESIVDSRVGDQLRGLLLVALLSLAIASAVAWLFAASVVRPLRRLHAATDRLAAGDLSTRAPTDEGPREIRDVADSFNSMAARTEQLVERQRSFAGTASHQLRTPLTALRLRLEQLSIEAGDDEQIGSTVENALIETDRLRRMIEGLLALSRAEDTAVGPDVVDLAVVLHDRAEHWRPLAEESDVRIDVAAATGTMVSVVPGAAEQIIDNLIDNALEVSAPGSRLSLTLLSGPASTELHVIDEGPGLSEDERRRAFERFWRADGAAPGGSGLGLAIVHQLANASGGNAELRTAPGGGVDATVTLPNGRVRAT
ncbi:MAG: two-component sensor histidine kinase [Acidimicrobiaceae bacterium]|nr:two-component sensor histidine kinase [Acidimicrobiaceae bacterium]